MKTLSDITEPQQVERKLLEADVQKKCVDWARSRGYWARKFSSMTSTAEPDYIFAIKVGGVWPLVFAVEFKRPGNTPTEAQSDEMTTMRAAGWLVFWCDNFDFFKQAVLELEHRA